MHIDPPDELTTFDQLAYLMSGNEPRYRIEKGKLPKKKNLPAVIDLPDVGKPSAWDLDPLDVQFVFAGEVPDESHPGTLGLDYLTLMLISRQPWVGAPFRVRIDQVADFATRQPGRHSLGYKVVLREKKKEPTKKEEKEADRLERLIERAGGENQITAGFEGWLRAIVRDSLTYDQANSEVLYNRAAQLGFAGKPVGFVPVDAATIRRAKPSQKALDSGRWELAKGLQFVQVLQDKIRAEFEHREMIWGIRRPRTWIATSGYGYPEIEEFLSVVTSLLNATTYNNVSFTNGVHTSSILAVTSAMEKPQWTAFRRMMKAYLTGVRNAKKTPMVQLNPDKKEQIQAINLSQTNKEMEYSNWINWNLKLMCAVMGMDAAELGFVFGNEGQTNSLSTTGPGERIVASKERSLRPLLRAIASWLNRWIIHPINPDFELEFTGMDAMSQEQKLEYDVKAVQHIKTINEVRAEHDLEPLDEGGDIILNPTFLQAYQAGAMGGEEQGYGEPGGAPDEEQAVGEQAGFDWANYDFAKGRTVDDVTREFAARVERAIGDGRALYKGTNGHRPRRKYLPIETVPGCRTYLVEVDP